MGGRGRVGKTEKEGVRSQVDDPRKHNRCNLVKTSRKNRIGKFAFSTWTYLDGRFRRGSAEAFHPRWLPYNRLLIQFLKWGMVRMNARSYLVVSHSFRLALKPSNFLRLPNGVVSTSIINWQLCAKWFASKRSRPRRQSHNEFNLWVHFEMDFLPRPASRATGKKGVEGDRRGAVVRQRRINGLMVPKRRFVAVGAGSGGGIWVRRSRDGSDRSTHIEGNCWPNMPHISRGEPWNSVPPSFLVRMVGHVKSGELARHARQ
jgi:hypothetical protein